MQRAGQGDVPVEMALVELIEDHGADAPQLGVERHLPEQDALGDEPDAGGLADAGLQPDLVADGGAEGRAHLLRDAFGEQAGGEAARLQHDDLAFLAQEAVAQQHLRDLGGFARTGGRLHDQPARRAQRGHDGRLELVDGQIARGRHKRYRIPEAEYRIGS